jgi:hypothetical protein
MKALVGMSQRAKGTQDQMSRVQMALDQPGLGEEDGDVDDVTAQQKLLQAHLQGDEDAQDQATNVLQVLERTDVLEYSFRYHLFDLSSQQAKSDPFPRQSVSGGPWAFLLPNADRAEAFISGFAASMVGHQSLPSSVLLWLVGQLCVESNEDLLRAYLRVLELSAPQLQTLMTPDKIIELFIRIGAKDTNIGSPITLSKELPDAPKRKISPHIRWIFDLLRLCCHQFSSESLQCSLNLVFRAAIDDSVHGSGDLALRAQSTLASLIDAVSEDEESTVLETLMANLTFTIPDTLRPAVISTMPSINTRHHLFRRHVALRFFLDLSSSRNPGSSRNSPYPSPNSPGQAHRPLPSLNSNHLHHLVLTHLNHSPLFSVNSETEYNILAAAMALLDVAIDAGFVANLPESAMHTQEDLHWDSASSNSESSAQSPHPESEGLNTSTRAGARQFNDAIDALIAQVRTIYGQIADGGVLHMNRVEAKETLDRLATRLEHAVRIGGAKKKGDLFVERRQENAMRLGIQNWLGRSNG